MGILWSNNLDDVLWVSEKHVNVMKEIDGWEELCADLECILLILFFGLLAPSVEITLNCSLISLELFYRFCGVYIKAQLKCTKRMIYG